MITTDLMICDKYWKGPHLVIVFNSKTHSLSTSYRERNGRNFYILLLVLIVCSVVLRVKYHVARAPLSGARAEKEEEEEEDWKGVSCYHGSVNVTYKMIYAFFQCYV